MTLTQQRQTVPLSNDAHHAFFSAECTSTTNTEFLIALVTQDNINNNDPVEYQRVQGSISGDLEPRDNQSLVFKSASDQPVHVRVTIGQRHQDAAQDIASAPSAPTPVYDPLLATPPKKAISGRVIVFGVILVVVVGFGIWWYMSSRSHVQRIAPVVHRSAPSPASLSSDALSSVASSPHANALNDL